MMLDLFDTSFLQNLIQLVPILYRVLNLATENVVNNNSNNKNSKVFIRH